MKIEKKKLADLPAVYVTSELSLGGRRYYAAASENPGEHAYIFDTENDEMSSLWIGDTGCMNVIQIPGEEKLLAITKFYPVFKSKEAEICLLEPTEKGYLSPWKKTTVLHVPYVHRIGCFENRKGEKFLFVSVLCRDKDYVDDWSKPGACYVCKIGEWKLTKLVDGLLKNHGLWIGGKSNVYVTSENGVMYFDFANYENGMVVKPKLLSGYPTSDLSVTEDGYATIEPFHGDKGRVYSWDGTINAEYDIDFGHVVWYGDIFGKKCVIFGSRGGEKTLQMIDLETGERTIIDKNVGPTQITVVDCKNKIEILSANHGAGIVNLYTLTK